MERTFAQLASQARDHGRTAWLETWGSEAVDLAATGAKLRWEARPTIRGAARESRFALRNLARRPGYALAAIITLGLGIGGVATLLSVVEQVLLAPLPYADDANIGLLWNNGKTARPTFGTRFTVSMEQIEAYEESASSVEATSWVSTRDRARVQTRTFVEQVAITETAWNFFEFAGATAQHGRLFGAADAEAGARVVVLSDAAWRSRYGARDDVIGTAVSLSGVEHTIIGVLPRAFRWYLDQPHLEPVPTRSEPRRHAEFWIPGLENPLPFYSYWLIVRPRAASSIEEARAEFAPIAWEYFTNPGFKDTFEIDDAATADSLRTHLLGATSERVPILAAAVASVLLLASLSVAHLSLGRIASRQSELALRRALGGSAARVVALVVAETTWIVVAGTAIGIALAQWGLGALRTIGPTNVPRIDTVTLDPVAIAGAAAVAALTLVPVAAIPAWYAAAVDSAGLLRSGTRGGDRRTARTRQILIAGQVAAAVFLLVAATLVLRSLYTLSAQDTGFSTSEGILTASFRMPSEDFEPTGHEVEGRRGPVAVLRASGRLTSGLGHVIETMRAMPGMESVALARFVPLSGSYGNWSPVTIEGWETKTWEELVHGTSANWVEPAYFDVLGIRPLAGRLLEPGDALPGSPSVAVVSESFADLYWPGEAALGKRFYTFGMKLDAQGGPVGGRHLTEVVGVVPTLRETNLRADNVTAFLPFRRGLYLTTQPQTQAAVLVRTRGEAHALAEPLRSTFASAFPEQPLHDVQSMSAFADSWVRESAFFSTLLALFGAYGLLLSLVGIGGVVAYQVSQRTREVAVRITLGARDGDILGLFGREIGAVLAAGILVGLGAAIYLSRFLASWLYGIGNLDPASLIGTPILFAAAALAAGWFPARRALRQDPADSLRAE